MAQMSLGVTTPWARNHSGLQVELGVAQGQAWTAHPAPLGY